MTNQEKTLIENNGTIPVVHVFATKTMRRQWDDQHPDCHEPQAGELEDAIHRIAETREQATRLRPLVEEMGAWLATDRARETCGATYPAILERYRIVARQAKQVEPWTWDGSIAGLRSMPPVSDAYYDLTGETPGTLGDIIRHR